MRRHFTVTGFVSRDGRTALHWHRLGMWLPPGGHVEADEDPVQAVVREVEEETGLIVRIVGSPRTFAYASPPQLQVPVAMAVYDIPSDSREAQPHQHVDFIYFTAPVTDDPIRPERDVEWRWFDEDALRAADDLQGDVRELALAAIEASRAAVSPTRSS